MRHLFLAAATAVVTSASPALAVTPSISFTQGNFAQSNPNATVIQNFNTAPAGEYTPGANETKTGSARVMNDTIAGVGVDPDGVNGNNYLAIINGSYGLSFAAPVQYLSFVLGTLDAYNSLSLSFADGTTNVYNGNAIVGQTSAFPYGSAGRVVFDVGGASGITRAVFASTQAAFEIDGISAAVPEPATWAMTMLGLGLVGGALRTRRTRKVAFKTA